MPFVSPKSIAQSLTGQGSPRVVAELDDSCVKVAKVLGEQLRPVSAPQGVRPTPGIPHRP